MPPKPRLYVIHSPKDSSLETVRELEQLLEEAKAGSLTGIAYVALHNGAGMSENVLGRCKTFPILCVGMLHHLIKYVDSLT